MLLGYFLSAMHKSVVRQSTPVGFEPTRGDPIGLAGRRLSRSAKVSYAHSAHRHIPRTCSARVGCVDKAEAREH
jgi:hypothetical protein